MPWDPIRKQYRAQRDIDLDRSINDLMGPSEERNLSRMVNDTDTNTLRALVDELRTQPTHPLKSKLLNAELQRLLQVNRDFENVTGEGSYNPGSFSRDVPNWNNPPQSNPENSTFRGPVGIPSRWRKPPDEGGTGFYFEAFPKTWEEFRGNVASNILPNPDSGTTDENIRKVMNLIGPGAINMLAGSGAIKAPIRDMIGATREALDMRRPVSNTFKLDLDQAKNIWDKYRISFGAEGIPRWEIGGAPGLNMPSDVFRGKLGTVLDWPELYRAYPALRNRHTDLLRDPYAGNTGYNKPNLINASGSSDAELMRILAHELQHNIQGMERRWSAGGGPSDIDPSELRRVVGKSGSAQQAQYGDRYEAYRRLAGEVEARAAENALSMTSAERALIPPQLREDYPRDLQILRFFED